MINDITAILLKDISDEEAMVYVVETNLMQRSFADMVNSEKAAVLAMQYDKMFSQGKRNDIINALKTLEKPHEINEMATSPQVGAKLRSDGLIGESYGLSKNTVARYLRINHLISELKTMLDNGTIKFIPSVTLSFLKETEQYELAKCIEENGFSLDMKKADTLRQYSEKEKLNEENIQLILSGKLENKEKTNRVPVIKVNKAVYSRYFNSNQSAKEIQDIVEKALERYFEDN